MRKIERRKSRVFTEGIESQHLSTYYTLHARLGDTRQRERGWLRLKIASFWREIIRRAIV